MTHLVEKYVEQNYPLEEHLVSEDKIAWVYVIYNPLNNTFKIGKSIGDFRERIRRISTQSGVDLVHVISVSLEKDIDESCHFLEKWLHEQFKSKRTMGEWFKLSLRDLVCIKQLFWLIEGDMIFDDIKENWLLIKQAKLN